MGVDDVKRYDLDQELPLVLDVGDLHLPVRPLEDPLVLEEVELVLRDDYKNPRTVLDWDRAS